MYRQKGMSIKLREKKMFFCGRLEGYWRKEQDPDPLVKGTEPRIRILIKMSLIRNTEQTKADFEWKQG